MKTLFFILLSLLPIGQITAQEQTPANTGKTIEVPRGVKNSSGEKTEEDKRQNETLKKLGEKLDKYLDKGDSIGYIQLTSWRDVPLYRNNELLGGKSLRIESVGVELKNGTITSVTVKGSVENSQRVFSNSRTFIELSEINNNRCDRLHTTGDIYVRICDFLLYMGNRAFPCDTTYELNPLDTIREVQIKTGINNVFQAKVYSDLLGLAGDESNGLLQSELSFKANLHNKNLPNSTVYLGHYLFAEAGIARFDSKFRTVNEQDLNLAVSDSTDSLTLDYMDIYQHSYFFSTVKFNLAEWFVNRSYSGFSLNAIGGLNSARYQDSLTLPTRKINMPFLGAELQFNARPYNNFGLELSYSARYIFFFGIDDKVLEVGDPRLTYTLNMEMYWNPVNKQHNRIFARIRYSDMWGPSQPFSQVQIGYAVNVSDWIRPK